ncbi:hypothetical protein JOB18_015401 [Solea senegalensis]|uniref:Uncharacterized protein n=1 Tax=Solea senegalensis TaxID=28829 RepID=A0AAV6QN98_SOLSE|nr:hypothetical protein JOB18_015401 [Solea senegalensis]
MDVQKSWLDGRMENHIVMTLDLISALLAMRLMESASNDNNTTSTPAGGHAVPV